LAHELSRRWRRAPQLDTLALLLREWAFEFSPLLSMHHARFDLDHTAEQRSLDREVRT
jgi:hypothetical protein